MTNDQTFQFSRYHFANNKRLPDFQREHTVLAQHSTKIYFIFFFFYYFHIFTTVGLIIILSTNRVVGFSDKFYFIFFFLLAHVEQSFVGFGIISPNLFLFNERKKKLKKIICNGKIASVKKGLRHRFIHTIHILLARL